MIKKIINFFRASRPDFSFVQVEKKEMPAQYPNAIRKLMSKELDGFLVKNFLSKSELELVLKGLQPVLEEKAIPLTTYKGVSYPITMAFLSKKLEELDAEGRKGKMTEYYQSVDDFHQTFSSQFGVDLFASLRAFFLLLEPNFPVSISSEPGRSGIYPFGSFRCLFKDVGGFDLHCGNDLLKQFELFYSGLSDKVELKNQVSYFVVLQQAEKGGELTTYSLPWKEGQTKMGPNEAGHDCLKLPDGTSLNLHTDLRVGSESLSPQPGDLILFQGGQLWHRVETVKGNQDRITFGGFLGLSKQAEEIILWA